DRDDLAPLHLGQLVGRHRVRAMPPIVVPIAPPLERARGQPQDLARRLASCTSGHRLVDQPSNYSSLGGVVSSSSSPQIACAFFFSTSSAAASASALSF